MIYFFFKFRIRKWINEKIKTVFQCKSNWRIGEAFHHNKLSWYTDKATTCSKNESLRESDSGNFIHLQFTTYTFKLQSHKLVKHTQTICWQQPTNCLSLFDNFVELVLKRLNHFVPLLCFCAPLKTSENQKFF